MNDTRITARPIWDFVRLCAVVFTWALLVVTVIKPTTARSHDHAITGRYLYDKAGKNCCLAGGHGDCQVYPAENVRETASGYLLADGEVIPYGAASPSEDKNFYRCKWAWDPKSHCFFAPPGGV
jgi:hypothetical protein